MTTQPTPAQPAPAAPPRWPNLALFLVGISLLSAASGMFDTAFNNFVKDVYHLNADQRGVLEFPRELPGFLTAFLVAGLVFFSETRIAATAAFATGLGMLGLAYEGGSWTSMLVVLTIWSAGAHVIMPVRSSIGMDLAPDLVSRGRRLGQISGVAVTASIVGYGLVWLLTRGGNHNYRLIFQIGGAAALVAGCVLLFMRMPGAHVARPRLVWNRRYWLYYVLSFLFGARKQVFITFGPWVLVRIFNQSVGVIAALMIVSALLGILFQPLLGRAIDRLGERFVLMADAAVIFCVCIGYGAAHLFDHRALALGILYVCFVIDQLFFGTGMARDIYLAKTAVRKEDIAPTLSLGVTINHAVSMSLPALGGWLWMRHGHDKVFYAAAVVALAMFFFASLLRVPSRHLPEAAGRVV